jgi:exonuclease III
MGIALLLVQTASGEAAPVFLDGFFDDWTGGVEHQDPAGDGVSGGIDMRALDLANDAEFAFLRFDLTAEISLQSTNNLVLYLDTDQNAGTGTPISGIGAELKWQFGTRNGTFYRTGGSVTVYQDDLRLRQGPTVTSTMFEVALGRDVRPDGTNLLFPGPGFRVLLRHETTGGDQAPNAGQTLTYLFDASSVPPPEAIPFDKQSPSDVRITTWNVVNLEAGTGWDAAVTPAADRVLSAIDPDILCFQEIYDHSAAQTATLVESFLPSGPGEAWYARENSDVKVASRFPVLGQWNLDGASGDRNLAVLLDTSAKIGRQLLLVGAHMFCCTNDTGRQAEADRIMSFLRDAKSPGGSVTVPDGTMLLITGDLNLVGQRQQLATLTTGDIADEVSFGPDFAPDWDGSPLADLVSRQLEKRFAYTWRNDFGSYAPGRLDFFIYSDSVVTVPAHFLLYTPETSAGFLAQYGMQAGDVTTVSDHLPHTADFRPRSVSDVAGGGAAGGPQAWARLAAVPGPGRGGVCLRIHLDRAAGVQLEIFDVRGACVAVLGTEQDGVRAAGEHAFVWDGRTGSGTRAASGTYMARLTARAGDGAVLANSAKVLVVR